MATKEKSPAETHRRQADQQSTQIAVVTVSDTRTEQTDRSGTFLRESILAAHHKLAGYQIIKDEPAQVVASLESSCGDGCDILLFNGGTGIAPRDNTYDAVFPLLEKVLIGFGELFRQLSWQEIGAAAMLSRAVAGTFRETMVFVLPGSTAAVQLAWQQLIKPELGHLVSQLRGHQK